jgi:hypothetical protein
MLIVLDDVFPGVSSAKIEQIWHFGGNVSVLSDCCYRVASRARLTIMAGGEPMLEFGGRLGWRSRALGHKEQAYALCSTHVGSGQTTLVAALDFTDSSNAASVEVQTDADVVQIVWVCDSKSLQIRFGPSGVPDITILPAGQSRSS